MQHGEPRSKAATRLDDGFLSKVYDATFGFSSIRGSSMCGHTVTAGSSVKNVHNNILPM